jgi:hypothetical protein
MGIDPVKSLEIVDEELCRGYFIWGILGIRCPIPIKMINRKHLLINVTISTKWECATESPVTTNMCVSVVLDITLIIHVRIEIHMKM